MYTALRVASHVDYRLVFCSVVLLQSEMFTSADVALWWQATVQSNVGVTVGCSAAPRRQVSLEHGSEDLQSTSWTRNSSLTYGTTDHSDPAQSYPQLRDPVCCEVDFPAPSIDRWNALRQSVVQCRSPYTKNIGIRRKKINVLPVIVRP